MKKSITFLLLAASFTLSSCVYKQNNDVQGIISDNQSANYIQGSQETNTVSSELEKIREEKERIKIDKNTAYIVTNKFGKDNAGISGKLEIETQGNLKTIGDDAIISDWKVGDNTFTVTGALGGGSSTQVLEKNTGNLIKNIPFSSITKDGKFVVACNISGYSPGEVIIYSVDKQKMLYELINTKGDFSVDSCNNQYNTLKKIQFVTSHTNYSELFIFDFTTGKIGETSYRYVPNAKKWESDEIQIRKNNGIINTFPGFLQLLPKDKKNRITTCLQENNPECLQTYHLLSISPRERYLEVEQRAFESSNYQIYSLQEKKIIYTLDGYIQQSTWTSDNSQMIFISIPGMGSGSGETTGVFVSVPNKFPEFKQVISYQNLPGCEKGECDIQIISMDDGELQLEVSSGSTKQTIWIDLKNMKVRS